MFENKFQTIYYARHLACFNAAKQNRQRHPTSFFSENTSNDSISALIPFLRILVFEFRHEAFSENILPLLIANSTI